MKTKEARAMLDAAKNDITGFTHIDGVGVRFEEYTRKSGYTKTKIRYIIGQHYKRWIRRQHNAAFIDRLSRGWVIMDTFGSVRGRYNLSSWGINEDDDEYNG